MKVNYKQLKVVLVLKIKKFGPFFLMSKLDKFLFFDSFFPNLANFWNLDDFLLFKFFNLNNFRLFDNFLIFDNFLYFLINSLPLLIPPILLMANILLLISTYNDIVVFNIDISGTAILPKP